MGWIEGEGRGLGVCFIVGLCDFVGFIIDLLIDLIEIVVGFVEWFIGFVGWLLIYWFIFEFWNLVDVCVYKC